MHHHMAEHDHGMGMMPAVMGAFSAVLFAALVLGALFLLHRQGLLAGLRSRLAGHQPAQLAPVAASTSAAEYLDMALAKGEIDVAEYHERRSALRSHG